MVSSPFFFEKHDLLNEKSFHYSFFLPGSNYTLFNKIKEGAEDAANNMNCAISFHAIDSDPLSFALLASTGVDGISLYPLTKDNEMIALFNKLSETSIPVIQIENQIVKDENTFFVGTNNYESGKSIGKLVLKTEKELVNLVLIYSDKNPGLYSGRTLVEMGIKSVLGHKLGNIQMEKTSLNPLDAERLVYDLMRNNPSTDIIILTDPNDTMVAVQAIIDLNLVGTVQVIGFGDNEIIKEYIYKGLVIGSIVRNPYKIGYTAVMALYEISINGYTSAYVDTGINIITAENLGNNYEED